MKIAYDDQQQPGVFIPLEEWPRLRTHFSEVYDFVEAHTSKPVPDMDQDELDTRLYLTSEKINALDLKNGSYNDHLNQITESMPSSLIIIKTARMRSSISTRQQANRKPCEGSKDKHARFSGHRPIIRCKIPQPELFWKNGHAPAWSLIVAQNLQNNLDGIEPNLSEDLGQPRFRYVDRKLHDR